MWRGISRLSGMLATLAIGISSVEAQDVWIEPEGEISRIVEETPSSILSDIFPVQGYGPPGGAPYGGMPCPPYAQEGADGALYHRPIPDRPMLFSSQDPHQAEYRSFEGWFIRGEYLNWTFQRPGNALVGAPIWDTTTPANTALRTMETAGAPVTTYTRNPTVETLALNNANGARGTLGVPLTFGSLEASVFGFHTVNSTFSPTWMDGSYRHPYYLVSTFDNGAPGSPVPTYYYFDAGYTQSFSSSLYGVESNLIFDGIGPTTFFSIKPIAGVRFMELSEEFAVSGSSTTFGTTAPFSSGFTSSSDNRMWMGQAGLRFMFELPRFTFTFDPKYAMGANSFSNNVNVLNMAGTGTTWDKATNIANLVDLGMTGRIQLTEYFTLTAGYNFMWLGGISRPHNNLTYNSNATQPGVYVDSKKTDMTFQGFSVGGEFTYR